MTSRIGLADGALEYVYAAAAAPAAGVDRAGFDHERAPALRRGSHGQKDE